MIDAFNHGREVTFCEKSQVLNTIRRDVDELFASMRDYESVACLTPLQIEGLRDIMIGQKLVSYGEKHNNDHYISLGHDRIAVGEDAYYAATHTDETDDLQSTAA